MTGLSRDDYGKLPMAQLQARLASVQDRMARADTMEAAIADHYAEQELQAAIAAKREARSRPKGLCPKCGKKGLGNTFRSRDDGRRFRCCAQCGDATFIC